MRSFLLFASENGGVRVTDVGCQRGGPLARTYWGKCGRHLTPPLQRTALAAPPLNGSIVSQTAICTSYIPSFGKTPEDSTRGRYFRARGCSGQFTVKDFQRLCDMNGHVVKVELPGQLCLFLRKREGCRWAEVLRTPHLANAAVIAGFEEHCCPRNRGNGPCVPRVPVGTPVHCHVLRWTYRASRWKSCYQATVGAELANPPLQSDRTGRSLRSLSRPPLNGSIVGRTSERGALMSATKEFRIPGDKNRGTSRLGGAPASLST